jgi:voltage-gated potassium channel Kch
VSAETAVDKVRADAGPAGRVIVCGLRGIGLRIVEQLHRSGVQVTVLEEYADQTQLAVAVGWGVTTVGPFGSSAQTLTVTGIFEARAVLCVVDDDLANLEIALVAREMRPDVRGPGR